MSEIKDLISLVATIDLGILAAALTLLALYPALAGFAHRAAITSILDNEKRRKALFFWLACTALMSWMGLLILLGQAVFGVLIEAREGQSQFASLFESSAPTLRERQVMITAVGFTVLSLLAAARSGWLIVRMTSDAA